MELGTVRQVDIDREMQAAYLDYAMSVIVARALPDVRDGLKPVHRRILYAMYDMGLHPNTPYKKSARIVGEVLGKYHPHGDAAVYESMVRMAQDFSMRNLLVDGQGNFGSVDGDSAAAMRYTEARLHAVAEEMLVDINKDTIDFGPNFDGSLSEPLVLPSAFPNLIVNGSSGIAVGMATNIPPHNLGEVCDALAYMIDHYARVDDISVDELMRFIKGPDFPTGGIVYAGEEHGDNGSAEDAEPGEDHLRNAYAIGRGRIIVQAKAHIEEMSRNRSRIVVTELPYQVNKSRLIERIAELVRDGRLEGITDLRDESDRQGMRMIVEVTRNVEPRKMLSELFRLTPMRSTFGIIMLALVDGEPRTLSLRRMLYHFIEHRREIITRRSRYDLARAKERAHILEGLLVALANLDEVIQIIRRSQNAETAHTNLRKRFKLTDIQAQAILDMPLRRLAALERQKIEAEYKEKLKLIAYLEDILANPAKILGIIKAELGELKKKYGDARRSQIVRGTHADELITTDLLPDEQSVVVLDTGGQV
jgi:DNA gyrase subunit A